MRLNMVLLEGNLTRDAEVKYTSEGKAVASFGIAWNQSNKPGSKVVFIDVTVWEKLAENLSQYLTKGKLVRVIGHLSHDRWEKEGEKRSKHFITAYQIDLIGGKPNGEEADGAGQ